MLTLGTSATTSLSAVKFNASSGVMSDSGNSGMLGTYLSREGHLWIPRRGWVKVVSGDYVAVDSATGWPLIISANAIANGPYTHS